MMGYILALVALAIVWRSFNSVGTRISELESRIRYLERTRHEQERVRIALEPKPNSEPIIDRSALLRAAGVDEALPPIPPPVTPWASQPNPGAVSQPIPEPPAVAPLPPLEDEELEEQLASSRSFAARRREPEKAAPSPSETEEPDMQEEAEVVTTAPAQSSLEQRIGARWLVWLGGLSLIIGGAFFVGYAIENQWLSVGLRLVLSGLLGGGLIALAEKMRLSPRYQDASGKAVSLPQALAAAGAGILFASIYAAYSPHQLITQSEAFTGLAAVSLLTVFLSLRQGLVMAVIGLVGAFAVPLLVGVTGQIELLLGYLLAVTVVVEIVRSRRDWPSLYGISLLGNLFWGFVLPWYKFAEMPQADLLMVLVYLLLVSALFAARIASQFIGVLLLLGLFMAKLLLILPQGETQVLLLAAGFAIPLIAGQLRRTSMGSGVAAVYAVLATVLATGSAQLSPEPFLPVLMSFAAVLLIDAARRGHASDPAAQLAAFVPLPIISMIWGFVGHFESSADWTMTFAVAAVSCGLAYLYAARGDNREKIVPAILLLQCAAALVMMAVTHFAKADLSLVLVLYVPLLAALCRRSPQLGVVLAIFAGGVLARHLFATDLFTAPLQAGGLVWIGQTIGVPLLAYGTAAGLLRGREAFKLPCQLAEMATVAYAVLLPYALVRYTMGAQALAAYPLDFHEASLIGVVWLVLGGGLLRTDRLRANLIGKISGSAMAGLGILLLVLGPMTTLNPLVTQAQVHVFELLLAYGVPMLLFVYGIRLMGRSDSPEAAHASGALALAFGMMLSVLLVFLGLRGPSLNGALELRETTLLGLLWTGLALLATTRPRCTAHPVGGWMIRGLGGAGALTLVAFNLLFLNPLWHSAEALGTLPLFNWLLLAYAAPAVIMALLARVSLKADGSERAAGMVKSYAVTGLIFAMSFLGLEVLHLMRGASLAGSLDFREAALIGLLWLALAYGLLLKAPVAIEGLGRTLAVVSASGGAFMLGVLSLLILNPLWEATPVGDLLVLNWLLVAYGVPALLLCGAIYLGEKAGLHSENSRTNGTLLALVYLLVWISLEVRHVFHGSVLAGKITQPEWYSYSALWLLSGFALLAFGVWRSSRLLRQLALGLVLVTVAKIFLSDMSALTGLWRAFSFMGLGLALMGVGYLYQRFVIRSEQVGTGV